MSPATGYSASAFSAFAIIGSISAVAACAATVQRRRSEVDDAPQRRAAIYFRCDVDAVAFAPPRKLIPEFETIAGKIADAPLLPPDVTQNSIFPNAYRRSS